MSDWKRALINATSSIDTDEKPKKAPKPSELMLKCVKWYNEASGDLNEYDGYNCSKCKNKGTIAKLRNYGYAILEVVVPCDCKKTRAVLRRAERSGLNDVLKEYTFKNFNTTEEWQKNALNTAVEFCKDDNAKWFYIGGQVGSGKTHLCTAIAAHYIKTGHDVKYMLWAEESKLLKSLVNDKEYREYIEPYKTVEVLYIDDFLKARQGEAPTSADLSLAFELINRRMMDGDKVTIISSEKTLEDVMDYDEATMSRIYQKTGQYKIDISKDKGKNYRRKEMKQDK